MIDYIELVDRLIHLQGEQLMITLNLQIGRTQFSVEENMKDLLTYIEFAQMLSTANALMT